MFCAFNATVVTLASVMLSLGYMGACNSCVASAERSITICELVELVYTSTSC